MPSEDPNVAESDGTKAGATVSSPTAVLISSGGEIWLHGVGGRGRGGELFVFGLTGAVSREIHSLSRPQSLFARPRAGFECALHTMQVEATPASTAEGQLKAPSSSHLVPVSCTGFRSSTWETHVLADWQDTLVEGAVAGAVASTGVDKARNLLPWHIALSACASRSSESCPSISAKSTTHQLQTTKMVSARRQLHQPRGQKQPRWRRRPPIQVVPKPYPATNG